MDPDNTFAETSSETSSLEEENVMTDKGHEENGTELIGSSRSRRGYEESKQQLIEVAAQTHELSRAQSSGA